MSGVSPHLIMEVFGLLGRVFPPPLLDEELIPSEAVLKEKSTRWNWISGAVFVPVLVACGVGLSYIACLAATRHLAPLGQPLFLIRAEAVELCVWAIFLAFLVGPCLTFLLMRVFLGRERYREFMMVTSHASKWGGEGGFALHIGKVFWCFLILFGPLLLLFIVLRIDSYTAFTKDSMAINSMWSLGKTTTHPYQNIRGIYDVAAIHGNFQDIAKPHHAIVFNDGTIWRSSDGMRAPRLESDLQFIQQVSQLSGKPLQGINFLEDVVK